MCVCVCVCVREREREIKRERSRERERERECVCASFRGVLICEGRGEELIKKYCGRLNDSGLIFFRRFQRGEIGMAWSTSSQGIGAAERLWRPLKIYIIKPLHILGSW